MASLMFKWMKSINTSSYESRYIARRTAKALGLTEEQYRKFLSKGRGYLNVVEKRMSSKDWKNIRYDAVPAKATAKYVNAFMKHDKKRYQQFVVEAAMGGHINVNGLNPVDITKVFTDALVETRKNHSETEKLIANAQWDMLPNYFEGEESAIAVIDTSASMTWNSSKVGNVYPIDVAMALGIYCAERCKGPFQNRMITFNTNPEFIHVKGNTLEEKIKSAWSANVGGSTNIEAVFDMILTTAVRAHLKQEDLPQKLYIISDMQFNPSSRRPVYSYERFPRLLMEDIRQKYAKAGYTLPAIVYWNVSTYKAGINQDTYEGENTCMVGGYSATLFRDVIRGTQYEEETIEVEETVVVNGVETVKKEIKTVTKQKLDPITVMLNALNAERYDRVYTG